MYRPQFPYPLTPAGFRDDDSIQYFDWYSVPLLNNASLANGAIVQNIALQLQSDAPFYWRGIQILGANGTNPLVAVQFKDPYGNTLSSDYIPTDLYWTPNLNGAGFGFVKIPIENEVRCREGSVVWLSIKNNSGAARDLTQVRISLMGVKRRIAPGVKCAA